jgi:23S rRNA (pseudouridine1915-N3)-methyltransferase
VKVLLFVIGKTDERYLEEGIQKYTDRIVHYLPYEMLVFPDLKNRRSLSPDQQKKLEGEMILAKLQNGDEVILLDEKGKQPTSRGFSELLERQTISGLKRLIFVVGGPYGFSPELYARAQGKLSLSAMTFSHQMVRLIFVEQLYRALTIIKGEQYHND